MRYRPERTQSARAARLATLLVSLFLFARADAQEALPAAAPAQNASTTIEAERVESVSDVEISAQGKVELSRDGTKILTESLKYNREFGQLEAEGNVRLQRGPDRFSGPSLRYNVIDETGVFEQPTYLIRRQQTSRGSAERIEFLGKDRIKLDKATFTTCAPGNDDWVFKVEELELDYEVDEARAKSPRLRFMDTTIAALPFATLPLEKRRKSGFLTPRYTQTTLRGAEVEVPFYWNIAPEYDATLTPVEMAKRGTQLKSQFRYLGRSYTGNVRADYMPEDRELRESRQRSSLFHTQQFTPNLSGQLDLNRVSDDRYFADFSTQVQQVTTGNLNREGLLTYRGSASGWGYGIVTRVQRFQTLRDPKVVEASAYHRVPQLNLSTGRNDLGGFADLSLPVEYVQFTHPTLVEGERYTLNPTLATPVLAPGWHFTPKLGVRYAGYDLTRHDPGQPARQSASIPWLSVDGGLAFDRQTTWFGERVTQTLEPRIFYVYAPYRNQDLIPIFDTALSDFNYAQIFSENRFSGGDRFGDANEVTVAATSRLLAPGGQEAFRATIGQRFYFQDERVRLNRVPASDQQGLYKPEPSLRTYRESDVLASVGGRISRNWLYDTAVQYNQRASLTERYSAGLRYSPEIAKVLSANYRFNRDPTALMRQIDVAGQWPVWTGWYAVARYNYSFLDRRVLESLTGLEYNGGCWVFRGLIQRIQATTDITSTALYLQLEFNGFGQIGTEETVRLLRRGVPGYAVTNPRDPALVPPSIRPQLPAEQTY